MPPFESGILHDLDDYERFLMWRNGAAAAPGARIDAPVQRDLVLLHAETLKVAAFAAAAASLATHALATGGPTSNRYAGGMFSAGFSDAAGQRMAELPQGPALFELHKTWVEVEGRLAFANLLARERSGPEAADVIPLDLVVDAWARACAALLAWHRQLTAALAGSGIDFEQRGEADAVRLLGRAAAGECACIDAEGKLTLPGWAERRREQRRPLSLEGTTLVGLDAFASRLENISQRGLGLAVDASIPLGTPVAVALPEGRTLEGRVRWSGDGGIGVELDEPLSNDDPLLQAASPTAGH